MRKVLLNSLLALGIASAFVACSKDEDTTPTAASIVGRWAATSEIQRVLVNGSVQQNDTVTYSSDDHILDFQANGAVISSDSSSTDTSFYTYNNGVLKVVTIDPANGNDTVVFTNTILTNTSLSLSLIDTQVFGSNTVISQFYLNFKKK